MIPEELLQAAERVAEIPAKSLNPFTVGIYQGIAQMKAAKRAGISLTDPWLKIREALDTAAEAGEWEAFEDFRRGMEKIKVETITIRITEGETLHVLALGEFLNRPRQPITTALVDTIRQLQGRLGHTPDRQEILDEMAARDCTIDETELSSQLTSLSWNSYIPKLV